MQGYELFSDQLPFYEQSVENIFEAPLINPEKIHKVIYKNDFQTPSRNYLMCFTNRSGSTLLAMMLAKTGAMGNPGEIFNPEPLTNARQKHGIASFADYLDFKIRATAQHGTFGAKIGIHQLAYLAKHGYLKSKIPAPKFIYVTRNNLIMQAISLYIAWETGAWTSNKIAPKKMPEYNADAIARQLRALLVTQAQFETFFAAHQIQPLRISYEAIEADLEKKALQVCRYVGIAQPKKLTFSQPPLRVQRTELNEAWAARFISDYQQQLLVESASAAGGPC